MRVKGKFALQRKVFLILKNRPTESNDPSLISRHIMSECDIWNFRSLVVMRGAIAPEKDKHLRRAKQKDRKPGCLMMC